MPWNVFTQSSAFSISGDQLAIELFIQCQNYEKSPDYKMSKNEF